jgi:hypothetical protein
MTSGLCFRKSIATELPIKDIESGASHPPSVFGHHARCIGGPSARIAVIGLRTMTFFSRWPAGNPEAYLAFCIDKSESSGG